MVVQRGNMLISDFFVKGFGTGSIFGNAVSTGFSAAFGGNRDCRGRPQGDYFFGCQVIIDISNLHNSLALKLALLAIVHHYISSKAVSKYYLFGCQVIKIIIIISNLCFNLFSKNIHHFRSKSCD